jgi:hypothetical protein
MGRDFQIYDLNPYIAVQKACVNYTSYVPFREQYYREQIADIMQWMKDNAPILMKELKAHTRALQDMIVGMYTARNSAGTIAPPSDDMITETSELFDTLYEKLARLRALHSCVFQLRSISTAIVRQKIGHHEVFTNSAPIAPIHPTSRNEAIDIFADRMRQVYGCMKYL